MDLIKHCIGRWLINLSSRDPLIQLVLLVVSPKLQRSLLLDLKSVQLYGDLARDYSGATKLILWPDGIK